MYFTNQQAYRCSSRSRESKADTGLTLCAALPGNTWRGVLEGLRAHPNCRRLRVVQTGVFARYKNFSKVGMLQQCSLIMAGKYGMSAVLAHPGLIRELPLSALTLPTVV